MKTIYLFLMIFLSTFCNAQNDKTERESYSVSIKDNKGTLHYFPIEKSNYFISDKLLQIFPNEKLFIELEIRSDTIYAMKSVKKNLKPKKTLIIEFMTVVDATDGNLLTYTFINPFNKNLLFNFSYYYPGDESWYYNELLHIEKRSKKIYTWDEILVSIRMSNWKFD